MEEEDDDAEYSDDDDVSWKVRRAAAKLLSAIVVSRPDKLGELFPEVAPVLIARFKEREENVKMDVFATFNDLLQQVATISLVEPSSADSMAVDGAISGTSALLQAEVPRVVKAISRQLKEKSVKTRVAAFNCLRQLVSTLPGCLAEHAASLVPGIDKVRTRARPPPRTNTPPRHLRPTRPRRPMRPRASSLQPRASGRPPCAPGQQPPARPAPPGPAPPRRRSRTPRPTRCASRRCSSCSSR